MVMNRLTRAAFPALLLTLSWAAEDPRLIRSLSGPSGTVSGSTFVFDETRNRFVFPQDKSLTVYFEWKASPGKHVLSGLWKQPDGRIATISPDVKIEAPGDRLNCYWIYHLTQGLQNGVWTLDVRIDGQPAGSHPFEIAGMEEPKKETDAPTPPPAPKQPTVDEIFKAVSPSLVWIHKLDSAGRKDDTSTGFVLAPNRIVTAFQAVDGARGLEVEFPGGLRSAVAGLTAWSRTGDWAVLTIPTQTTKPLERGNPDAVAVGERLIVFSYESGARTIGGVDITGRSNPPGFGARIQIAPAVASEAAGGPLLDVFGRVVGVLGGSLHPGARYNGRATSISPSLWNAFHAENAATPISEIKLGADGDGKTFQELATASVLTAPITPMPEFQYGGATNEMPKGPSSTLPPDLSDFSLRDAQIYIYTLWIRKGKLSKGEVSAKVYDARNQVKIDVAPRKLGLGEQPVRLAFGFSPAQLTPGVYRVDVLWDGQPAWRTFLRLSN